MPNMTRNNANKPILFIFLKKIFQGFDKAKLSGCNLFLSSKTTLINQ
jgi:hypothetical protein